MRTNLLNNQTLEALSKLVLGINVADFKPTMIYEAYGSPCSDGSCRGDCSGGCEGTARGDYGSPCSDGSCRGDCVGGCEGTAANWRS